MLNFKIDYDICALATSIIFICYYYSKKRFKSVTNKVYTIMIMLNYWAIFFEIAGIIALNYVDTSMIWINYVLNCGLLLLNSLLCYSFSIYVLLSIREGRYTKKNWYWYVAYLPAVINVLLIVTSPLTKFIIFFDENGSLCQSLGSYVFYGIMLLYLAGAFLASVFSYKRFERRKRIAIYMFIALIIFAVVFRILNPEYLLTGMASTIGILAIYLAQQNPQDIIGQVSGLFNRNALVLKLNDYINKKKTFSAIVMTPDDLDDYYEQYGYLCGDSIQRRLADIMVGVTSKESSYVIGGGKFVVLTDERDCDETIKTIKTKFEAPWEFKRHNFLLTVSMCCLHYPDDVNNAEETEELINMLEAAVGYAAKKGQGVILAAEEYISSREKMIGYLEKQQHILERRSRKAEEAREAAERADRAKSTFLANMSHEIRTPMTAILGMTEILLRDNLTNEAKQNLLSIQNAGRSLLTLINDILDFSKIEAGKMEIVNEPYHIMSTLDNAINMILLKLQNKDIEFFTEIDPRIPSNLIGDETRVRQILLNMLSNAAKYTIRGSIALKVLWQAKGEIITFVVEDTGRGISEENLAKLFDSFERFDTKTNKAIEGTGLGLAISKRLVENMNGKLEVESELGKGSKFSFSIHQDVADPSPLAVIDDAETIKALIYVKDKRKANNLFMSFRGMRVISYICESIEEIQKLVAMCDYNHVVLDKATYEEYKPVKYDDIKIYMIYEDFDLNTYKVNTNQQEYTLIMMPVNCISLAAAFMGNTNINNNIHVSEVINFTAPEARILVVDDNYVNLQLAKKLMAPHNMKIDGAESGQDGLYLTEIYKYDMIFLDHMMPVMDGVETLKELKKRPNNPNIDTPVIAFTANAISGVKEELMSIGFTNYLSKPINIERMESLLYEYLPKSKIVEGTQTDSGTTEEKTDDANRYPDNIPNVNMEIGIANVGGDKDQYMSLLQIICIDGKKKKEQIEKLHLNKDYKNYTIEVHALKSNMATIGASELSELAKLVEKAGKDGKYDVIEQNHDDMMVQYSRMIEDIEQSIAQTSFFDSQDEDAAGDEKGSEYDIEEVLMCTVALIRDFKYDTAEKVMKRIVTKDNSDIMKEIREIYDKFDMFAYDEIEAGVDGLLKRLEA